MYGGAATDNGSVSDRYDRYSFNELVSIAKAKAGEGASRPGATV